MTTLLAEVDYCCDYADQSHFQCDFLRATNLTPRAFRRIASGRAARTAVETARLFRIDRGG